MFKKFIQRIIEAENREEAMHKEAKRYGRTGLQRED